MESGENGRTKLGSFLVFLVFLVAESLMWWLIWVCMNCVMELGLWDMIQQLSSAPKSLPSEVCEWMHGEMQKEG